MMQWTVSGLFKYNVVPHSVKRTRSKAKGPRQRGPSMYRRILSPLLVMERDYPSQRAVVQKWAKRFLAMDRNMAPFPCALFDAMRMSSDLVTAIADRGGTKVAAALTLHSIIDIVADAPSLEEERALLWIRHFVEHFDAGLLLKEERGVTALEYAQSHRRRCCSKIILYLKRKQEMLGNGGQRDVATMDMDALRSEVMRLRAENELLMLQNAEWKNKYFMATQSLNEPPNGPLNDSSKQHIYPTPNGVNPESVESDLKSAENVVNDQGDGYRVKEYREWNGDDIVEWIMSLDPKYEKFKDDLRRNIAMENICGKHLLLLGRDDLGRLGIVEFGDKFEIVRRIRALPELYGYSLQLEGSNDGNKELTEGDVAKATL